jgi:DNA mismatch endonuclease (patch repair protein)
MTDIFTPEKRSWVMSRIKGKDTKIELRMKQLLEETGYRFEMHPEMYGNPDFVHKRKRITIFCDGDFWHGYRYGQKKRLAKKFWRDKIENKKLRRDGWSVLRLWEHDIERNPEKCRRKILAKFHSR